MSADPQTWVLAVERAYVATVVAAPPAVRVELAADDRARFAMAAAGAVASRYLAVGTPRSMGVVADDAQQARAAEASLLAHRVWFQPRDIRCAGAAAAALAAATGGTAVGVLGALAADIVCIHAPGHALTHDQLRRGTHVNVLAAATLDPDLARLAHVMIARETTGPITLGQLAAGLVDGRVLDELTLFVAGDVATALAAL